jgi:hypothetical protein
VLLTLAVAPGAVAKLPARVDTQNLIEQCITHYRDVTRPPVFTVETLD